MAASKSFSDRTIIVTGAAGTIGRAVSTALAGAWANVVLVDVAQAALETFASTLQNRDKSILPLACSSSEADAIVTTTLGAFGRIDAIVNVQAILRYAPFEDVTTVLLQEHLEANVIGPMALVRAAWPTFKKQGYGRVVNFTSDSIYGMVNSSAYVLTKGALLGVNKTLAVEGAPHGILVNCVAPVAYGPLVEENYKDLPKDIREGFKALYTGESNIAMILALLHEKNSETGQIYTTGGWGVGRAVLGTVAGPKGIMSMEDAQDKWEAITSKEKEVFEPAGVQEYVHFKASFLV